MNQREKEGTQPAAAPKQTQRVARIGLAVGIGWLLLALVGTAVRASVSGIIGFSGNPATGGGDCNICHTGGLTPDVALMGPSVAAPGALVTYTLRISGGQETAGGFNVSTVSGTLATLPGTLDVRLENDELTHTVPKTAAVDGTVDFTFHWTAPAITSTATLYAAGNSVNGDMLSSGDGAATAVFPIVVAEFDQQLYLPVIRR